MAYSKEIIEFHRYTPGVPEAEAWGTVLDDYMDYIHGREQDPTKHSGGPNRLKVDLAWIVCMRQADIIDGATARRLLSGLLSIQSGAAAAVQTRSHGFAERSLIAALGGDEDLASLVNLGRTLQEPMSRLDLRDSLIQFIDKLLLMLEQLRALALDNTETVMPGHTHLSQAQPITLAAYLLSLFDGMVRGLEQIELAYRATNRNSGGCGATSGITWPVDRWQMTELLGFDDLVEPTYDSEAAQDHSLSILFALTNIMVLLSKSTMDFNIWGMEETGMIKIDPAWHGVSSMMPNKSIPGTLFERSRIEASWVIGYMQMGVSFCKGEPHADMLPMLEVPKVALDALARAGVAMGYFRGMLGAVKPQREQMLAYARAGFSCSTEVAAHMVKALNYGPRRAHRVVATMVRLARERGLKAYEVSGELLDEAARFAEEREPGIDSDRLRRLLDPVEFVRTHDNTGGVAPEQTERMLADRRSTLESARERQRARKTKLEQAEARLQEAVHTMSAD